MTEILTESPKYLLLATKNIPGSWQTVVVVWDDGDREYVDVAGLDSDQTDQVWWYHLPTFLLSFTPGKPGTLTPNNETRPANLSRQYLIAIILDLLVSVSRQWQAEKLSMLTCQRVDGDPRLPIFFISTVILI